MNRVIVFILLIIACEGSIAQGHYNPFKLLIIKPDTAIIDKSLYSMRDSIESERKKAYHFGIQKMEELLAMKDYPKSLISDSSYTIMIDKIKAQLKAEKEREGEIMEYKYYECLSWMTWTTLSYYLTAYEPAPLIKEISLNPTKITEIGKVSDSLNTDYIIYFENVKSKKKGKNFVLELTTNLYCRSEKRLLFSMKTIGDVGKQKDNWVCQPKETLLSCLFSNALHKSINLCAMEIVKREKK